MLKYIFPRFVILFVFALAGLSAATSGDPGGQPNPNNENTNCIPSPIQNRSKVDIGKLINPELKKLTELGKQLPVVKDLSVTASGTLEEIKAEECCNKEVTKYREISGKFGVVGVAEFYLPGAGFKRPVYFRVSLPRFLGGHDLFVVDATLAGGFYGGARGEGKGDLSYHISEDSNCKQCLSYTVNFKITGTAGVNISATGTATLFGSGDAYPVGATGDLHGEVPVRIFNRTGLFGCPKLEARVCVGGLKAVGTASLMWGRWNYDKTFTFPLWDETCFPKNKS
jgi:hypothetical protein